MKREDSGWASLMNVEETIPKFDVYRKKDMRLMLVNVTAKEAAKFAGCSEGFVWASVKHKNRVATLSGYCFYYNEELLDLEGEGYYRVKQKYVMEMIKRHGFSGIKRFCGQYGLDPDVFREVMKKKYPQRPNNDTIRTICSALGVEKSMVIEYREK